MGGAPWRTTFFSSYLIIYTSVDHGGFCQSAIEGREVREAVLMSEPLYCLLCDKIPEQINFKEEC